MSDADDDDESDEDDIDSDNDDDDDSTDDSVAHKSGRHGSHHHEPAAAAAAADVDKCTSSNTQHSQSSHSLQKVRFCRLHELRHRTDIKAIICKLTGLMYYIIFVTYVCSFLLCYELVQRVILPPLFGC